MEIVYVSHQFGGDKGNLVSAKGWMSFLLAKAPQVAWIAPWITDCEVLDEETDREAALLRDVTVVKACSALLMVGVRVSEGMAREMAHAARVYDLTGCVTREYDDDGEGVVWASGGGVAPYTLRIDPRDILGRIVDGKSVGIDWLPVERTYHGETRMIRRPRWACTAEEIARWGR